jgi:phosphatidylinositol kinase/protein kinase (PI-3  family)
VESEDNPSFTFEVGAFIAKSNDDLRQEVFVMQMIHYYRSVFANEGLPIWLKTYRLLSVSQSTGMIELLKDSTSIDGLKKSDGYPGTLKEYFVAVYGKEDTESFKAAQHNFMTSLVGYSLVAYLLGLKDRHNGNIMIDLRGHLIHIDFGFAMGMAPGHEFSFERAPFKFTHEYLEVMGGTNGACYAEFKRLFVAGFEAARANSQVALGLVEIMMFKSNYPCFSGARYGDGVAVPRFKERLMLHVPDNRIRSRALQLIEESYDHTGTQLYDVFQLKTNGIAP